MGSANVYESPGAERPTLYVISGSHACRTGMLMLEHKGIGYRLRVLPTGPHGMLVRLLGFPGNRTPIRQVDGGTPRMLAMLDRLFVGVRGRIGSRAPPQRLVCW